MENQKLIFKEDFNLLFDVSMCSSLEEIKERANHLNVNGLNVGKIWEQFDKDFKEFLDKKFLYSSTLFPDIKVKTLGNFPMGDMTVEYNLVELFDRIGSISSSNEKSKVLSEFFMLSDKYTKECIIALINLTYSTIYVYDNKPKIFAGIKDNDVNPQACHNLATAINTIIDLASDDFLLPKDKKEQLINLYKSSNIYIRNIIKRVLDGNLITKMSEKSFFDCLGHTGLIRIIPYQRCEKEAAINKRARFPMMIQLKADGKFQNLIYSPIMDQSYEPFYLNKISLNRSGKNSSLNPILEEMDRFNKETNYFVAKWSIPLNAMGEALIKDPNYIITENCDTLKIKVLHRKQGNGLLNSYGQRFVTYKNKINNILPKIGKASANKPVTELIKQLLEWNRVEENLIMQLWDMVPFGQWLNLDTDFTMLKSYSYVNDFILAYREWTIANNKPIKFFGIWNEFANTIDEVYEKYNYINKELGFEGIVAKNLTAMISHGVCTDGKIKFKDFKECDLRIVGFIPGEDKYTGGIGSYIGESECGKLRCSVAGISDSDRGFERVCLVDSAKGIKLKDDHNNEARIGQIMNVKFNELSTDKQGNPSLSLPNLVEFRDDVLVADTYEEIIEKAKKKKKEEDE